MGREVDSAHTLGLIFASPITGYGQLCLVADYEGRKESGLGRVGWAEGEGSTRRRDGKGEND